MSQSNVKEEKPQQTNSPNNIPSNPNQDLSSIQTQGLNSSKIPSRPDLSLSSNKTLSEDGLGNIIKGNGSN